MQINKTYITACGKKMALSDRAKEHLLAHPEVIDLLPEAIGKVCLQNKDFAEVEVDLGRIVGVETRVAVQCAPDELVHFSLRPDRDHPSRVVLREAAKPPRTSSIVIIAVQDRRNPSHYKLITAWVGKLAKKEPWDRNIKNDQEREECLRFWCSYALIHDPEVMGDPFQSTWNDVLAQALGGDPRPTISA